MLYNSKKGENDMANGSKKQHKRGPNVGMRLVLTGFFILLQIGLVFFCAYFFAGKTIWIYAFLELISIIIVIYILNKKLKTNFLAKNIKIFVMKVGF